MKYFSTILALSASAAGTYAQVTATNPMGATNPATPSLNTPVNQTSQARLLSVNSAEDFCIFGGFGSNEPIGNIEGEVVAWCTKPRNNARVIPDGTFTGVTFYKAKSYVQLRGYGNLTNIGLVDGDFGGELDPHGAYGLGNPVGGNVTSNVSGKDVNYEEWMEFVGYQSFCIRVCTANAPYPAALMCEHELDVMGCDFVMPGSHDANVFQNCESDDALPPGLYIQPDGSTSTFRQYFTGVYTADGVAVGYTVGQTVTPAAAQFTPSSSNCVSIPSISNGLTDLAVAAVATNSAGSESSVSGAASGSSQSSGSASASSPINTGSAESGSASGSASRSGSTSGAASSRSTSASSARSTGASASSTPSSARTQYAVTSWAILLVLAVAPVVVLAATY